MIFLPRLVLTFAHFRFALSLVMQGTDADSCQAQVDSATNITGTITNTAKSVLFAGLHF
jgi:hypothetical protein